jgi:crotonobetainyl-CoA:carnitine CoA-transferase CaiB-like acyl-CoA transferase
LTGQSKRGQYTTVAPLEGLLVVDLSRYLPGPFATRQLLLLGARVVRVEPPEGDPLRAVDARWDAELNAGKESVVCDLKADPELAQALCRRADAVVEGFRPGVATRLGLEPGPRTVWCAITGFGSGGPHEQRVGHDLNYLGWAGVLTGRENPPVPIADFTGAFAAVREILAALLERAHTGRGARIEISMTHEAHRLAAPRLLTAGFPNYRLYECADGRFLTVGALEPRFWSRLLEVVEATPDQLEERLRGRPLAEWLELLDGEEVCAGPVRTPEEAAEFAEAPPGPAAALGEHTQAWRAELGLS